MSVACEASVSVGFQSKKSPKNGIFEVLSARKMGREQFAARKMGREQKNERHHPTETLATQAQVSGKRTPGYQADTIIFIPTYRKRKSNRKICFKQQLFSSRLSGKELLCMMKTFNSRSLTNEWLIDGKQQFSF